MHPSIQAYIYLFEELSDALIEQMDSYVSQDVHFKDPFNDVSSLDALKAILKKTLADVENPDFKVLKHYKESDSYILKWHFSGNVPVIGLWEVEGLSEIELDENGKIKTHIDYWDTSEVFYMKIPILGAIIRKIRQRLRA